MTLALGFIVTTAIGIRVLAYLIGRATAVFWTNPRAIVGAFYVQTVVGVE
jgi:hypothetical protein